KIALFHRIRSPARRSPADNAQAASLKLRLKACRPSHNENGSAITSRQNAVEAGPTGLWRTRTGPMPVKITARMRSWIGVSRGKPELFPQQTAAARQRCALEDGDWVPGRAGGPGDEERREYIGKFESAALDQAFEGHSLVQIYAIL